MLEQKKWPHWKGRERMSQEYHSKKVLGKIWDFLEAKFKEAIGGVEQEVKADDRILKFVTKCLEEKWVDETTVVAMRKKYKKTIQRYLMERELHAGQYNEGYFKWHDQICKSERSALLLSEKGQDRKLLVAAILYEQAADLILETSARDHKKAMGFAWCVASDYLCRITSDLASEDMGSGKLPFPLVQDMTSVLLGRDKRS
jgi:2-hydroxy-3-keto-5-methylthiopentenyl-1-phosphate phosphatase